MCSRTSVHRRGEEAVIFLSNAPTSLALEKEPLYGLDDSRVMKRLLQIYALRSTN